MITGDILWEDILKADYRFGSKTPVIERDEEGNVVSIRDEQARGKFDGNEAIVFIDNVARDMVDDGVSINDINHLMELIEDVDIHEHSHEAMAPELKPHYDKIVNEMVSLIETVEASNFIELKSRLEELMRDYTEILFMEELYAYSSEKHAKMKDLRHNYDLMDWVQIGIREEIGRLTNAQRNIINLMAQVSERKWNMLYLTFEDRILTIKGD